MSVVVEGLAGSFVSLTTLNDLIKSSWPNVWFSSNELVKCKINEALSMSWSKDIDIGKILSPNELVGGIIVGGIFENAFKVIVWNTWCVSPPGLVSAAYTIYLWTPGFLSSTVLGK